MSEILEQLEVNSTFLIQFFLFAVFFFIISGVYLKPFQKIIEKRNKSLKNDVEGAAELLKTVENKLKEYEKALVQIRAEAKASHDQALMEARSAEDATLSKHKDELKKEYLKVLDGFQDEKLKVESELKAQVAAISDTIAQKVLAGK
jgi:F-type H+-transporting ATPase subunit b